MTPTLFAFLALMLGPLDAARGGYFDKIRASLATWVYAAAVALMLGATGWLFLAVMLAFRLGESSGWGCPLGAALDRKPMDPHNLEWWQVGPLARNVWLALYVRGLIWGLPMAALGYYMMVPVMGLAMVAAPAIVVAIDARRPFDNPWGAQEFLRGWIIGALLLILQGAGNGTAA